MSERIEIPLETKRQQRTASDPAISAWVSANAGSGKTFVLTRRVIRLLLSGVEPSRILCLTFTKAAAAEMSNRVFQTLGKWVALDDAALEAELQELTDERPAAADKRRARTLFALSLDSPGGLKIQTIHAFCEALLHQFPLEANVSGHFTVIEDAVREALIEEARRQVILEMETGTGAAASLREAFASLLTLASDAAIEKGLGELIDHREEFLEWTGGDVADAMEPLWRAQGIAPGAYETDVIAQGLLQSEFSDSELHRLAAAAELSGQTSNVAMAERFKAMLASSDPRQRYLIRNGIFLTQKNEFRSTIFTKPVLLANPGLADRLEREKAHVLSQLRKHQAWRVLASSQALFAVGEAVLSRYFAPEKAAGPGRLRRPDFRSRQTSHPFRRPALGSVQAGQGHRSCVDRRGAGHQSTAVADHQCAGRGLSCRSRRQQSRAHGIRGWRREAVDLLLPGRGPEEILAGSGRVEETGK